MISGDLDPFHREVARVALSVAQRYGFVLGGGLAWVLRGLVVAPRNLHVEIEPSCR